MYSHPWSRNGHGNGELHKNIDGHAHVWNHCVALQRRYYAIYGKYIGKFRLMKHLSKLKKLSRFAHLVSERTWNQLPSQAIQDVAARIDKGYKKMFEDRAAGKKCGRPRFKPRRKYKSFTLVKAGWKLLPNNRIKIGKRVYRYFKSREIQGTPKRCTVKRDAEGDVYICVLTDYVEPDQNRAMPGLGTDTGHIAGFDFGLKRYLTGSNGHDIESPLFFKRSLNAIKRFNRKHSTKRTCPVRAETRRNGKGSKNRGRARLDLARKHHRIANQREDFHWKLAHQLTDRYDEIRPR